MVFLFTAAPTGPQFSGPDDATIEIGQTNTFSVSITSSTGALSYQWFEGGTPIPGETGESLTPGVAGVYTVQVTDDIGPTLSDPATLTVVLPTLSFTTNLPSTAEVNPFSALKNNVQASNPSAYQWSEVGLGEIPGETAQTLSIVFSPEDNGRQFFVTATDIYDQQLASNTVTISLESVSNVFEGTAGAVASNPDTPSPSVTWSRQDFASTVVALEGQVTYEDDYVFSGRTFRRRDRTLNPREE